MAEGSKQPLVGTLGMFIIDTFRFIDASTGQDLGDQGRGEQIGGGGTYFAVGARMWLDPGQIAMVIDRGIDFEPEYQKTLDHYAQGEQSSAQVKEQLPMWKWRDRATERTTKAVNVYKGEQRGFEYLSPKLRLEADDLADADGRLPSWVHCICNPERAMEICDQIDQLDVKVYGKKRPTKVCWEPIPDSAKPENLRQCLQVMKRIDVLSPNHEEAAAFLSIDANEVVVPSDGLTAAQSEQCRRRHLDLLAHGFAQRLQTLDGEADCPLIAIRGGAAGSVALYRSHEASIPAWHGFEDSALVVDVTGGGNSFLGGFIAAIATGKKPAIDDGEAMSSWLQAALRKGAVSAAVTIEQLGLPRLEHNDLQETWNDQTVEQRLQKYGREGAASNKRDQSEQADLVNKKQKMEQVSSTPQRAIAKVVPGEWLCHIYIAIPLIDHSKLAKIIRKAYKLLQRANDSEQAVSASSKSELVSLLEHQSTSSELEEAEPDSPELHISLTQPICIRAHEREDFTVQMTALLQRSPLCNPFALSFAGFAPLPSMMSSIYPPRIYHTLEAGQGHAELHALTTGLKEVLRQRYQGRSYSETPRFHGSFAFDEFVNRERQASGKAKSSSKTENGFSPVFDFVQDVDEEMLQAQRTHLELEEVLGEALRTKTGGAIQVRSICIKVGKRVTRVPLRGS